MLVVSEADGKLHLFVRRHGGTESEQAYAEFGGLEMLNFIPSTNLIYDSRICGLGILDPKTGERLFEFTGLNDPVARVDANRSSIFVLDMQGVVRALRHPLPSASIRGR